MERDSMSTSAETPASRATPGTTRRRAPHYAVVVVGAGPAGLAAATAAASGGARVALLDDADRPGGQYWRGATSGSRRAADRDRLLHGCRAERLADHTVWHIEHDPTPDAGAPFTVHALRAAEQPVTLHADRLVLAPGAYDRQVPFPGWDLPGVLAAGGVQALAKSQGVVAGRATVVAGSGPFLLAVAAELAESGWRVVEVCEANRPYGYARDPLSVAANPRRLREAAHYLRVLRRHRIPYRVGQAVIAAHGDARLAGVTVAKLDANWRPRPGTRRTVECDTLAVGYGFTPRLELPLLLGCATWVDADGSLVLRVDDRQRTSVRGVYAAGEACGVGGAALAMAEGEIAGLAAAGRGGAEVATRVSVLRRRRTAQRRFAALLHRAHPLGPGWIGWLDDATLACRCEEVPVAAVRAAVTELGARDPHAVKMLTRAGMGWCQGRVCGVATCELTARLADRPVSAADLASMAHRPFAAPVPLRVLADDPLDTDSALGTDDALTAD
jgi:thioredoxin reductase